MRRSWLPGLMVILVGVIYLLSHNTSGRGARWWALFVAVTSVWFFERAWFRYRAGNPPAQTVGLVTSGLTLVAIAGVLFFDLSFGRVWPVFIIIAGIGSILRTRR